MYRLIYAMVAFTWWQTLCYCLQQVETGGCEDPNNAIGDDGASLGSLQISREAWLDATEYDQSIGGAYDDCRDYKYSCRIAKAYLTRYGINKGISDPIKLARIFNRGPSGYKKESSVKYGSRFKVLWEQYYVAERVVD